MSPVIRVAETTYTRLEHHVRGFSDTPDRIINMLCDHWEATHNGPLASSIAQNVHSVSAAVQGNLTRECDLSYTRIDEAVFGDATAKNWVDLLRVAHQVAISILGSLDELQRISPANIRKGHNEGQGFHYIPDLDISIQNESANNTCDHIIHLAQRLNKPFRVRFRWPDNERAAYPNEIGEISWEPASSRVKFLHEPTMFHHSQT